jgi:hypothetical protein
MRCAKCGYISFDYLSECKKCRADLAAARDSIGYLGVKPAVPLLLGSLISMHEAAPQPESAAVETQTLASFSFQEEVVALPRTVGEVGEESSWETPKSEVAPPPPAAAASDEAQEDFSLLDLSDEELELLIDKEALGYDETDAALPGGVFDSAGKRSAERLSTADPTTPVVEFSLPEVESVTVPAADRSAFSVDDFPPRPDPQTVPLHLEISPPESEMRPAPVPDADEPVLDLDDSMLELDDSDTEIIALDEPIDEPGGGPAGLENAAEAPAGLQSAPDAARPPADNSADDFVLELSEDDLDALLEELGGITPKGTV